MTESKDRLLIILERRIHLEAHKETESIPLLWTIPQVGKALGLGKTKIYELIWKEKLPVQKFGRAVRVSPAELQRWLEARERS